MVKGIAPKLKWKKKRWFSVMAPGLFNESELGQIVGMDDKSVMGRTLKLSAFTVLNDPRKQHKRLTFKVDGVVGDKARTFIQSYQITESHLKRVIRKSSSRIDIIINGETKDKKKVVLKLLVFTTSPCKASQKKDVRAEGEKITTKNISKIDYDSFVMSVLSDSFQKEIKKSLKKVHPLKLVEVVKFRLLA